MADTTFEGVLGQVRPADLLLAVLHKPSTFNGGGATSSAIATLLEACNPTATDATFDLKIAPNAEADVDKHFVRHTVLVPAFDTLSIVQPWAVRGSDEIRVKVSAANTITFTLHGRHKTPGA